MRLFALAMAAGLLICGAADARTVTLNLHIGPAKVAEWTVYELSGGSMVPGTPVYVSDIPYGKLWGGLTIPFTDNDGFWTASRIVTLPANAANPVLTIKRLGIDDRAVLQVNGNTIASFATNSPGAGYMQLTDPGTNDAYTFTNPTGRVRITDSTDLHPGANTINVIVNNTNAGMNGGITGQGPSNFGWIATVTYSLP